MIETIKDTSTGKLNINSKKNIYIPNKIEYEENNNVSLDDIFDKYIEQKELYEPVKIYEIKNIKKISFGLQTSGYSLPEGAISFVVNGPIYGFNGKPLGGYIELGKQKKEFIDPEKVLIKGNFSIDNGIFGLGADGDLHLVSYQEYKKNPILFQWAFQNGPILVKDGVNMRGTSTNKECRSGIGFTADGISKIIYSDKPVTLREFAQLFVDNGCIEAIYLDGSEDNTAYQDESGVHGEFDSNAYKLQIHDSR